MRQFGRPPQEAAYNVLAGAVEEMLTTGIPLWDILYALQAVLWDQRARLLTLWGPIKSFGPGSASSPGRRLGH